MLRFPGGGLNGTHPIPAPSLRELLSAAKLRECTPMNVTAQKFQSSYALIGKPSAQSSHRTTLPQSALAGCQLPQRGSRETSPQCQSPIRWIFCQRAGDFWGFCVGGIFSIQPGTCETARLRAIFIAPTELRMFHILPFIGRHSLSLAFARQLPQRGSRDTPHNANHPPAGCFASGRVIFGFCVGAGTFYHSTRYLRNRGVTGDFHRPYEGRVPFIGGHSLSLAFARQLPQRGSRDWAGSIQPGTR